MSTSLTPKGNEFLYRELSNKVIGACFTVHNKLGSGLPEHCFNRALIIELESLEIPCTYQKVYEVTYDDQYVGHFIADVVVSDTIILELKVDDKIKPPHISQLLTYLTCSGLTVGYVINYGARSLQFKRIVRTYDPSFKKGIRTNEYIIKDKPSLP